MSDATTKVVDREYLKQQFKNFNDILVKPKIQDLEDRKVDKVQGYSLSKNDFTDALKTKLEGLSNYDDTELVSAINTLNGDINTEGSVAKTTADAVAAIVASAPSDFDTLKEISDWISGHADSAAAMNSQIQANTQAIAVLNGNESTAGSVAHAVKEAIDLLAYEIEDTNIDFSELDKISISGSEDLVETSSGEYSIDLTLNGTLNLTSDVQGVTWSSSDDTKVTVNNGALECIGGEANDEVTITVSKSGYTSSHIVITILEQPVSQN